MKYKAPRMVAVSYPSGALRRSALAERSDSPERSDGVERSDHFYHSDHFDHFGRYNQYYTIVSITLCCIQMPPVQILPSCASLKEEAVYITILIISWHVLMFSYSMLSY